MAKKFDHIWNIKKLIASDPVYQRKLRERMHKIWQRQCPLRLAIENIRRRKAHAERMADMKNRLKERKRQRDWYRKTKAKKQKRVSGFDLSRDSMF